MRQLRGYTMRGALFICIALSLMSPMHHVRASQEVEHGSKDSEFGPPRIERLLPMRIAVGDTLEIHGSGFSEDTVVLLNRRALALESISPTRLRVRVPESARNGTLIVKSAHGEARLDGLEIIPYYPPPRIESVSPDEVRAGGLLHIRGTGFGEDNRGIYISVGGAMAEIVERRDDRLIVRVPKGARTGTLIVVVARGGQAIAQLPVRVVDTPDN